MDLHNNEPNAFGGQDTAALQDAADDAGAARAVGAAQVLIRDANGAVVLPAGTELGDIRVEGRDLVVIGADGVRYVIPDGAIVVPQLVVGDVAIPPLNLAALLVGNEPQPAAGNPQSSGGNFASAVGPLQAAFDLGDLLPYTELAFPDDQEEEIIPQPLDRDPLVTIVTPDQPAGAQNATSTVAEAGLPARAGEPAGSNAAATSEITSGTFVFSSPDGVTSLTINGTVFTGVGQTFISPRGTLTITSFDPVAGTIGYTYTLTDNLVGATLADQFTISLTDPDGDVASATLTINVADDAPTARNDTDAVAAGSYAPQTGNVITAAGTTSGVAGADTLGADNAAITRIASNNVAVNADTSFDGNGNLQVTGQYGTLLIKADGSYSYTRAPGTPGGVNDAFAYTLTDSDGSASTATLTIAIADAAPVITSVPPTNDFAAGTLVFEAGLPARPGEAAGTNAPAPTETTSGTVTFTGGDGPVTATINGVTAAPGAMVSIPGVGTLTVTTFDPATGVLTYSFTLADNTAGDNTSATFNVVVTDVDGDTAPGTFTIAIRDDAPTAANDSATQATENAPVTVNLLGNDTQGADSVQPGTVAVVAGTLSGAGTLTNNANGTVTYAPAPGESGMVTFDYTITDGDGDVSRATATIALLADSTPTLAVAGDNTVDEAALSDGSNPASTDETATGTITITTGGDTLASLLINGVNVTTGGTVTTAKGVLTVSVNAGAYSYSYTLSDNTLADPDSDTFTLVATDSDGDTATSSLVVAIADDRPDARDDVAAQAVENAPITVDVLVNDVRGADGVANSAVALVAGSLTGAGTLAYNNNGTFTYTPAAGEQGAVSFNYRITDGDGDSDTATVTITLVPDSTPTISVAGDNSVDEAALSDGSNPASTDETAIGTIPITTGGDSIGSLFINGVDVTAGGTVTTAKGALTVTVAGGAYSYSYTLSDNTLTDPDSDSFAVTVTDSDGDTASTNLVIAIADDAPTARADVDSVKEDGATTATGNVITAVDPGPDANATDGVADTTGADGASVTVIVFNPVGGGAAVAGTVGGATAGAYGTLTLNANGSYSYALDNGHQAVQGLDDGEALVETFTYTLTDADGDARTTTLTITIAGTNDAPVVGTGAATVSEEGLALGVIDAAGNTDTTDATVFNGAISITDADGEPSTVTLGDPGAVLTADGQPVTWAGVGTGTLVGSVGAVEVIRIAIDNTGAFTVTLSQSVDHATINQEDIKSFVVPVSVSDGTATVPTTLTVTIEDDSPIAANDPNTTIEGAAALTGNVLANDLSGADTPASVTAVTGGALGTTFNGAFGTLLINADGSYTYTPKASVPNGSVDSFTYTMRDSDGDTSTAVLSFTYQGDANKPTAGSVVATLDDDALGGNAFGIGDEDANAGESPVSVSEATFNGKLQNDFGLDGAGEVTLANLNGNVVMLGTENATLSWDEPSSTLTATGPRGLLFSIVLNQATGEYTFTLRDNVLHDGANDENNADRLELTYQVIDSDGSIAPGILRIDVDDDTPVVAADTDAVTEDGAVSASGNVLTGAGTDGNPAGADSLGADGAASTGAVDAVRFGATAGTVGTPLAGTYGSLTLNADGSYTYTPNNANPIVQGLDGDDTLTETFTYTVKDGDQDTASTNLVITIKGADDPVIITGLNIAGGEETVREDDLVTPQGSSPDATQLTQTGSFSVAGVDGITTIVVDGVSVFGPGAVGLPASTSNATYGTLKITSVTPTIVNGEVVSAVVNYEYTLNTNTTTHTGANAGQLTDSFSVTVTDTDGSTATDSLDVVVVDDVPTARNDGTFDVAEQTPLVISALGNDTFGADGVSLTAGVAITALPSKGTVTYNPATGQFTYTPNNGAEGADSFQYTITDGDGDPSTATVTLNLLADSTPTFKSATNLAVDEDGFAATANADAAPLQANPAETDGGENLTDTSGIAIFDFKADVPAVLAGSAVLVDTGALDGQLVTLTGQNVVFALEGGALVGRAGSAAGAEVIRITLTTSTAGPGATEVSYGYSVTLSQPVRHATAGTEDLAALTGVTIEVTDFDGDKTTGMFDVTVRDDVPSATDEAGGSLAEGATVTGTLDFVPGADGASVTAVNGTALVFDPVTGFSQAVTLFSGATAVGEIQVKADGSYSFTARNPLNNPINAAGTFTVTDRDGDAATANIAFTVTDANAPTGGSAAAAVDDDGLAGGNAASTVDDLDANTGDAPADLSEATFTGTLTFTPGGDNPATVTFAAGVNNSFAQVGLERVQYSVVGNLLTAKVAATAADNVTVQARAGMTLFTVEITNANTGAYRVTLVDNVLHAAGPNQENAPAADATASIGFTVTDSDGSTAATTLNVTFDDDAPTASNTSGTQAAENQNVTVDITGTYAPGADGVDLAAVTHSGATQGTVSYNGAGLFTYTPNSGAGSGGNTTDSFTYTVVDADGDMATATITITLKPDSAPVANDVTAKIDDDGLAAGNPASNPGATDDDQNVGDSGAGLGNESVWVGSLSVQPGANDTPLTYSLASAVATGVTVGAETADLTYDSTTRVLTATVAVGNPRAGTVLFTVTITDANTGAYRVDLVNPILHLSQDATVNDDTENNTSVALTYTVRDADTNPVGGDADTGLLTIDFDDDTPSASAISATQATENTPFDIVLTGNYDPGADGLASITYTSPSQGTLTFDGTKFVYTPNAGAGSPPAGTADSFSYTIIDTDGDKVTQTVSITLKPDSTPSFKTSTNLTVDEDGFAFANADNGQPNPTEVTGPNSLTDTSGSMVFDFKNDVPTTLAGSAVLVDNAALDGQLVTLSGQNVVFELEGADLVGRAGSNAGAEVIRISLTGAAAGPSVGEVTYTYSTTLSQPVQHATAGTEDTDILSGVTIEVADRDGDKTTGTFDVTVRDDVPSLDVTKGADAAIFLTTQDAETDGSPTSEDTDVATVGAVTAAFAGVFGLAFEKGADGGATPALSYALNVTNSASGLNSHGVAINLYKLIDGTVIGSTAGANPGAIDGTTVFSVGVSATGVVTLTQYQQIDHAVEAAPAETPFDDQFASLADGLVTLTANSSLTDGDGDIANDSETVNIGANLRFADDGPVLSDVAAGAAVSIDETAAGANFPAPVSVTSGAAVITATSAFGADGPLGNTPAAGTSYGLAIAGGGTTPFETAIGGFSISLVQVSATVIEGRYIDGAAATQVAFRLTIGTDGKLTVEQRVAIEHVVDGNTAAAYDDALVLTSTGTAAGTSLINATITLKDFDGDTASGTAAIGGNITFRDDGVDAVVDTGSVPAGSSAAITGNVLANDYRGADGSAISGVTNAGAGTSGTLAAGQFTIQGQYGQLVVNASTGAYTYTRTPGAGGGSNDQFTYTLTDNDGDFDTATLTISIGDLTPVAGVADATVDDEGLTGGIAGTAASGDIDANTPGGGRTADLDQASTEAVFKGTLGSGVPASVPGDGANVYLFLAAQTATTIGQETVSYSVSPDGSLLTATIATSPVGRTGTLFTVEITNPATGAYTLTLVQPVLHGAGAAENDVDITLAYQLRDADLDTSVANGALSIKFDDDIPSASTVTNSAQTDDEGKAPFAGLSNEGASVGTDVVGSPATATGAAGSLFAIGADGLGSIAITGPAGITAIHDTNGDGKADQEAVTYTSSTAVDGSVTLTATGAVSGLAVFTLTIGANGSYTFTQVRALVHSGAGEDERNLVFSFTATDKDGDGANGSLTVTADDDTPIANVVIAAALTDDEGKAPFASSSIEGSAGDVAGSPAISSGAAGALFKAGADGFGSLVLTGPAGLKAITTGTASGTTGTSRQEDVAYDAPTVAPNGAVTLTARGVTSGQIVFTLTVNNDGSYIFTQSRALVHSGAGEDDKQLNFGFTLTDGDGDTASGSLRIDVDDDTPTNFTPASVTVINTGTALVSNQVLDGSGNGIFDNAGADGIASITFASAINGTKLSGPGGNLQSGGNDIYLYIQPNGSLIASTDSNPNDGIAANTTVFTATLNAATGTYTIDFDKTIDNGSGTKIGDFSKAGAGNTPWKGVDADLVAGAAIAIDAANDPNPDSTDLLITVSPGGTVNSDSDDIGVSNQYIDANEFVRIDLVQDLRFDPGKDTSNADGYLYDTHVGVTQATFKIIQVQSNPNATAAIRISAVNVNDANALSQSNVGDPTINTAVNLDHTTVQVRDAAGALVTAGITVYNEGNDIVVTGVKTGYTVSFGAEGNASFEAFRMENADGDPKAGGGGNYAGDNFAVGGFAYSFVAIGSPVAFTLPVVLTDGDGDTSTGNISVTVNPVTPVVLDLDGDGVEFATSAAGAVFDYNGDGNAVSTAWAGRDDGILALDKNGNGAVDDGSEIVFGGNGLTDLEGLAAKYDSNHDGVLNAADADFAKFGVWQDADGDGASDAGEFRSLTDAGIVSLSLTSDGRAYSAADGQVKVFGSTIFTRADGSTGTAADASFAVDARAAQRATELATTTAVAGAMIAAASSTLPATAAEPHARALPQVEAERVSIDTVEHAAPERFDARNELLGEPQEGHNVPADASAHFRGETTSARLVGDDPTFDQASPAPEYLASSDIRVDAPVTSLFAGMGAGGEGVMEALLSITGPQLAGTNLPRDPAAGLHQALSDFTDGKTVDAIVDHFAGRVDTTALPLSANDDGSHLLAQGIVGSGTFAGFAPMPDAGDDASALAAAQA